jgi:hypothetical protein
MQRQGEKEGDMPKENETTKQEGRKNITLHTLVP